MSIQTLGGKLTSSLGAIVSNEKCKARLHEPQVTNDGEITQMHTTKLENQINTQPEFWLWTHKRWKRKREN